MSDKNTRLKEDDSETEIRLKNVQVRGEETASTTLEASRLDVVCPLELLQMYDEEISEEGELEVSCNLESVKVYDDKKFPLSQNSQEINVLLQGK